MPINSYDPPKWGRHDYITKPQRTWTFKDTTITWAVIELRNFASRYEAAYWDDSANNPEDAGWFDDEADAKAACEALVLLHRK